MSARDVTKKGGLIVYTWPVLPRTLPICFCSPVYLPYFAVLGLDILGIEL